MKPEQVCEILEERRGDNTSCWTLRLSTVFERVKNNYIIVVGVWVFPQNEAFM